ncbi:MAG: anthranilate phosphoribosyltransferase [Nitrososphaerales archaeon]
MIQDLVKKIAMRQDLTYNEASECMYEIMAGKTDDISIANFLRGLKMKGETVDELKAMLHVMNEFSLKIRPSVNGRLIDTCGTGGDKVKTFNISTAAGFVASAMGVNVAKHGNRSTSGICGSADALEYFGYDLNTEPRSVEKCIEKLGIGFMFAPKFHPAMKNVANVRKQLGIGTVFNILGPLSNPAKINAQIIGVSDPAMIDKIIQVLKNVREEAMVFHAKDGLDEISNTCINQIAWIRNYSIDKFDLNPKNFKISTADLADVSIKSREESVEHTFRVLNGTADEKRTDVVMLNAAASLIVGNKADSFDDGIELARKSVQSGRALKKLRSLIKSCGNISVIEELERKWQNS